MISQSKEYGMPDLGSPKEGVMRSNRLGAELSFEQWKYEQQLRKHFFPFVDKLIIEKGRKGLWEVVEMIMKFMYKYHRDEMIAIEREAKRERGLAINEFGSNKDKSIRKLGIMPERIENLLRRAYNDTYPIPIQEFRRKFFQKYKKFAVAEKI